MSFSKVGLIKKKQVKGFGFKHRNNLAICAPEATLLARASACNLHAAGAFLTILVMC